MIVHLLLVLFVASLFYLHRSRFLAAALGGQVVLAVVAACRALGVGT